MLLRSSLSVDGGTYLNDDIRDEVALSLSLRMTGSNSRPILCGTLEPSWKVASVSEQREEEAKDCKSLQPFKVVAVREVCVRSTILYYEE